MSIFKTDKCARCSAPFMTVPHTMSRFNTDEICVECCDDEKLAPGYKHAAEVELAAVRAGNWNFPGVGLSPADEEFLAARRKERSKQ